MEAKEWRIKALTDIWTEDARGKGGRLIPTGLMGSLRWWFEVLARGPGGKAYDPTVASVRYPNRDKKPREAGHHCVVCELFGCTDWARKFRLTVVDENGKALQDQTQAGRVFMLRFIPLRPISNKGWCLLYLTLRLITDYGAIGGGTVFKPSEEWEIADLGAADLREVNGRVTVRCRRPDLPLQKGDLILEVEGRQLSSFADLERMVTPKPHGEPLRIKALRRETDTEIEAWARNRHHQDFGLIQVVECPKYFPCFSTLRSVTVQSRQKWINRWPVSEGYLRDQA